ncbi:hippocampus abundant transcript 1 protein isoform X2 [Selaginella moellendorffii]|uniref:hippocampus abundant transcript 1 protein isoform X2 n=1 Tax=Selaginella moellendorffii TaxID=88036 RepID=UPI000D1C4865|nr:hippocampus abundant transcript 1 protein isoform X2 [Selaginella moellendorffii]|eukprot:XP_024525940.1 hippocampus abundant transcript 1 protein isoform X2 [Selaginella moellendorffii]
MTESSSSSSGGHRRGFLRKIIVLRPLIHLIFATLLHIMATMMVIPALTDVLLGALCPGQAECNEAIYLTGIQQIIAGIGTMLVTPILGELSDEYGRKPLLMIPFSAAVLPMAILAYSQSRPFVYAYMVVGTVVRIFAEGGITCLSFAYVSDCIERRYRALAIGVLMGSFSVGYVIGILLARVLAQDQIFKVAAVVIAFAAVYVKVFLPETNAERGPPLLPNHSDTHQQHKRDECRSTPLLMRSTSSITDTVLLFKQNNLLTQVAVIVFFSSLGEAGLQGSLLYYLKATFGFAKDQFAELMLINGLASVFSQLLIMPVFVHFFGEKIVLFIAISASASHALLYGVAWADWVPYVCSSFSIFFVLSFPCIGSIVSKTAEPEEQGKFQGLIAGIRSFATILSPLAISPLTALFLSKDAPFNCPGFSLIVAGSVMVLALVQALMLQPIPPQLSKPSKLTQVAIACEEQVAAWPEF